MVFRVPERLAWVDTAEISGGDDLCLTHLPSGDTVVLSGTARLIWLVAVNGGSDVVAEVAELVQEAPDAIASEVTRFLAELVERGLIEEGP